MSGLLGDLPKDSERNWIGMPEYSHRDKTSFQSIRVHFRNAADRDLFGGLIKRRLTDKTRSIWYPTEEIERYAAISGLVSGRAGAIFTGTFPLSEKRRGRRGA